MKLIDPHIDIADLASSFNFTIEEFFSEPSSLPVTLQKMKNAEIAVAGFSLYYDSSRVQTSFYDGVKESCEFYRKLAARSEILQPIKSAEDLAKLQEHQIGYFLSIEGFDCLRSVDDFDEFYELGVRSFGFSWCNDNSFARGQSTTNDDGLSSAGYQVLERMKKREKLLVDISHLSRQSILDIDRSYNGMMIATHSNVYNVCDNPHNLSDQQIQICVDRGGVIGIFPYQACIGPEGSFDELFAHIDYIASKWGLEYVGLCSDIYPLPEYPFCRNHKDIEIMRDLQDYLSTKMQEEELQQLLYENWARVLRDTL